MKAYFHQIADALTAMLTGNEVFLASFSAEDSEFVRFNQSAIRQPGSISQRYLTLTLIDGHKQAKAQTALTGTLEIDGARLKSTLESLRGHLPHLPDDPFLLFATEIKSSDRESENRLPAAPDAVDAVLAAGSGRDLVGLFASGGIHHGFANSLGQRNWFSTYSFNLDWSFYVEKDKAVKNGFAGFSWDQSAFERKVETAKNQLAVLTRKPQTIETGRYRVYFAPAALSDLVGMMSWRGFGLKSRQTRQTPLIKLVEGEAALNPAVTLLENTADGVAPNFQGDGYIKPDRITLIDHGKLGDPLVSPRSAKEYGVPTNGASGHEGPVSLEMAHGELDEPGILDGLGTGVFINNVWYLNWSDVPSCKTTGMTRFATFWVENGEIAAPINVMRFDETLYNVFGAKLNALTRDRDMILDTSTYGARSTSSARIPGALVEDFTFTL